MTLLSYNGCISVIAFLGGEMRVENQYFYKTKKLHNSEVDIYTNDTCDGSISIMLALILVTLIAFLMTIYDYTRLSMIQVQSMSSYGLAADYMLSQYDPVLFQEYGILAGKSGPETDLFFSRHLEKNLFPSTAKAHDYYMDYILEPDARSVFNGMMEPEKYEFNIDYEPFLERGLTYPKAQIIDFMDRRLGLMLAKDWDSIITYFTKTSKTSSIIEEKNELVKSMGDMEVYKKQLYQLIDGILLYDSGDWTYNPEQVYIRSFSPKGQLNYAYFPDQVVSDFLKNVLVLEDEFSMFNKDMEGANMLVSKLFSDEAFGKVELENSEGQIEVLYVPQPIIEESIEELKVLEQVFHQYKESIDFILNLKAAHAEALEVIGQYQDASREHIEEIQDFIDKTQEDDELLKSVVTCIDTELGDIETELSSETRSLKETDNLNLIKIQIEKNLQVLSGAEPYLNVLSENLDFAVYGIFLDAYQQSSLSASENSILYDQMSSEFAITDDTMEYTTLQNLYGFAESFLSVYDGNILMDYSPLLNDGRVMYDYEDKEEEARNYDISQIIWSKFSNGVDEAVIDPSSLPSSFFEGSMENSGLLGDDHEQGVGSSLDENNQVSSKGGFGDVLSGAFNNASDNLYINQYAIEMFTNFNRQNDINAKALNGYQVNEHRMKYETEYIIGGSLDEKHNVDVVLSYIYAFRTSLNLIHLATDTDKRATIMHLASMVAGWWTGGVGAVIFAIIIAGLWAILESIADVFILTSGEKVPIIKTSGTWYTYLDGNIEELFNAAVRKLEDETIIIIEEGKDLIEEKLNGLNIEITEPVEELVGILGNQKYDMDEQKKAELEQEKAYIDAYLEEWIFLVADRLETGQSLEELKGQCFEMIPYDGNQSFKELIKEMADNVLEKVLECDGEWDLVTLTRIKKDILEEYSVLQNNIINQMMEEFEIQFNKILDVQLEGLKLVTEKAVKEKIKLGKKAYYDIADDIKEEYLHVGQKENLEKPGLDFLLPSMSYEDYLLLILCLPQYSQDTKVARILDLIQLNLQKKYHDEDINLLNYFVGVDVSGKVYAYSIFVPSQIANQSKFWEIDIESVHKDYR